MARTLTDLPNELLHQIVGAKGTRIEGLPSLRYEKSFRYEEQRQKAKMLLSLRATCRQLKMSYHEIFVTLFCERIKFKLTPAGFVVFRGIANDFMAKEKVHHVVIEASKHALTWDTVQTQPLFATAINQLPELRQLELRGTLWNFRISTLTRYYHLLAALNAVSLLKITLVKLRLTSTDFTALVPRLPNVTDLIFDRVEIDDGTWAEVFAACKKAVQLRAVDVDRVTENGLPLWKPCIEGRYSLGGKMEFATRRGYPRFTFQMNTCSFDVDTRKQGEECLDLMIAMYHIQQWNDGG
jgi:hypothetical protein